MFTFAVATLRIVFTSVKVMSIGPTLSTYRFVMASFGSMTIPQTIATKSRIGVIGVDLDFLTSLGRVSESKVRKYVFVGVLTPFSVLDSR